ncbi:uncharacterized protein F5891DRAFT_1276393, partial [Suillus fuscotomentosus]
MSDDILVKSLLTAPVPPACRRTWGTLLAAEFQNLYGPEVATALHTPPVISASLAIDSASTQVSEAMSLPWISASVDDLARHLEKLNCTDIKTCIHQFAPCYRSLYNRLSHQKTCNALANHVQQRALSLFHAGDIFRQILTHEFGVLVTEHLSQEIVSHSVKIKSAQLERKQNTLADVNSIRTEREWEWPMPVSKEVIFECFDCCTYSNVVY